MQNEVNVNQQQLDPSKMSVVKCKECDHDLWEQKFEIRRASPITSPTGQEMFVQIPMMVCSSCDVRYPVKGELS
jgi:hypothetical protein